MKKQMARIASCGNSEFTYWYILCSQHKWYCDFTFRKKFLSVNLTPISNSFVFSTFLHWLYHVLLWVFETCQHLLLLSKHQISRSSRVCIGFLIYAQTAYNLKYVFDMSFWVNECDLFDLIIYRIPLPLIHRVYVPRSPVGAWNHR